MNEELLAVSRALHMFTNFCKNLEDSAHYNYFAAANAQLKEKKTVLGKLDKLSQKERPDLVKMMVRAQDYLQIIIGELSTTEEVFRIKNEQKG